MQLPTWVHSGSEVLYVYRDGGIMMEVYRMCGDKAMYRGTHHCSHDVSKMQRLKHPWRERMEKIKDSCLTLYCVGDYG